MPSVIVDLSYLTACNAGDVRHALYGHTVVITFELIYEIMTNFENLNPRTYLDKLVGLDLVHSRALMNMAKQEIITARRTTDVIDRVASNRLAVFVNGDQAVPVSADVDPDVREFFECSEPQKLRDGIDRMWDPQHECIFAELQPDNILGNARSYIKLFSEPHSSGARIAQYYKMTQPPAPGWLIYEWERLRNFLAFHYRLGRCCAAQLNTRKLTNRLLDLHYVALLPYVDSTATGDQELIALAEVFGPVNLPIKRPPTKVQFVP